MTDNELARGKSVSFNSTVIRVIVFGRTNDETYMGYCGSSAIERELLDL